MRLRPRLVSARFRMLPDFMIIGTQRAGTSSLYRYLADHPDVVGSLRKETEYFGREHWRGETWYRAHFPLHARRKRTFEATPTYLSYPAAAARIHAALPSIRMIVMLRDPVDRAFSHHQHLVRLGHEDLGFAEALEVEERRAADHLAAALADPATPDDVRAVLDAGPQSGAAAFAPFSYTERGLYAAQLRIWFSHFPPSRFLVLRFEDLIRDPRLTLDAITDFLDLAPLGDRDWPNYSYRHGHAPASTDPELPAELRRELVRHFEQPNDELASLLGREAPLWP